MGIIPYFLTITLNGDAKLKSIGEEVKKFTVETTFTNKATNGAGYKYATYTPKEKSETLFIWLHGMGEGGRSALAENDGTSFYSQSLKELIDAYKKEVGATKVVLAGCSNGGYMTLRMALDHPTEYAAIVPICEALKDTFITDEQLKGIKDLPMYFIYSKDDGTVNPAEYEIPTIKRLKDLGATNLHVSTTDSVIDTSGTYKTPDNKPYQYNGHWSWIAENLK